MRSTALGEQLRTLSPLATLERGYAVARLADGRIVHDADEAGVGEPLDVIVARGTLGTRVEQVRVEGSEELIR
jgi:exodeoxyribonuclease VII large subunit